MIKVHVDDNILYVRVMGKIEQGDFEHTVEPEADHMISEYGKIRGILIDGSDFRGWDDFSALLEHIEFIRHHQEDVYRVALIGDSAWQKLVPGIAGLLLDPVIRRFDPGHGQEAEDWLRSDVFGKDDDS